MTEDDWKREWIPRIGIFYTNKFYSITPSSGYSLQFADPEIQRIILEPDVSDEVLGQAVLDTLKQSRFLPYEKSMSLKSLARENYPLWVQKMMKTYGYKNKTALFKNMKSCSIEDQKGTLKIKPTRHERLNGWGAEGISEDDYVYISHNSTPAEIGAALRLGFSRCKER